MTLGKVRAIPGTQSSDGRIRWGWSCSRCKLWSMSTYRTASLAADGLTIGHCCPSRAGQSALLAEAAADRWSAPLS